MRRLLLALIGRHDRRRRTPLATSRVARDVKHHPNPSSRKEPLPALRQRHYLALIDNISALAARLSDATV
jgi:hypothetical protein